MSTTQALYGSLSGFDSFLEKEVSILQCGSNPVLGVSSGSTWPSRIMRREHISTSKPFRHYSQSACVTLSVSRIDLALLEIYPQLLKLLSLMALTDGIETMR